MPREAWTDERLDDLSARVDEGFRESRGDLRVFRFEVRSDLDALRREMDSRFEKAEGRSERFEARVDSRFDALNARLDALQRLMIGGLLTVVLTVVLTRI